MTPSTNLNDSDIKWKRTGKIQEHLTELGRKCMGTILETEINKRLRERFPPSHSLSETHGLSLRPWFPWFFTEELCLRHLQRGQDRPPQPMLNSISELKSLTEMHCSLLSLRRKSGWLSQGMVISCIQPYWTREAQSHDSVFILKGPWEQPLWKGTRQGSKTLFNASYITLPLIVLDCSPEHWYFKWHRKETKKWCLNNALTLFLGKWQCPNYELTMHFSSVKEENRPTTFTIH